MSIYRHYTDEQLTTTRDQLIASLHGRLTGATSVGNNGRTAAFAQRPQDIRKEIEAVGAEIDRRAGRPSGRGPIYLV